MQQQIDAGRHAKHTAGQKDRQAAPVDRRPDCGDAEQLYRDTADDHHVDSVDRVIHQMKEQRATQRREGKSSDAGYCGSHENGDHDKRDTFDVISRQHRTFSDQKPEAKNRDDDDGHRSRIGGLADPAFAGN